MKKFWPRFFAVTAIVLLVLVILLWLGLRFNLAGVRTVHLDLPASHPGADYPVAIRVISTGESRWPAWMVSDGGGLAPFRVGYTVFEIVYADHHPILVDAPLLAGFADAMPSMFDFQRYPATVRYYREAATRARAIVFTHEHDDHLGGLVLLPQTEVLARTRLSRAQRDSRSYPARWLPPTWRERLQVFDFDARGRYALAPGVTLLRSPGHSVGSLSVYVQLRDGRRYLLSGDITWRYRDIARDDLKPWIVSRLLLREDRALLRGYMADLRSWIKAGVIVVPSHDTAHLETLIHEGVLQAAPLP